MPATTDRPPLRIVPFRAPTVRLALKPVNSPRGHLDGAWWPRTRDLAQELSTLADVLDPLWGRITRIAVNPMHWPVVPREIPVNGHVVKVGWFTTELDPHKIMLLSYTAGRWDLMVIPPESSAPAAARLMAAASESPGLPATASRLIAAEQALHGGSAADRGPVAEEDEARDGGGFPSSPALVALPSHLAMEV